MWDQRYSDEEYAYGTDPNDFLKEEYSRIPKGGKVLCLAEGEGRNAVFLASQGYAVTAVDQSKVGLDKATSLAAKKGVEIETMVTDLAEYDLGHACWDGIVSIFAHVPPSLRKQLHARVIDSLKQNGIFLLEAYTERHLELSGIGGPPESQKELFVPHGDLASELSGLDFIISRELEREISEGIYHQGSSAVVQLVAQKP